MSEFKGEPALDNRLFYMMSKTENALNVYIKQQLAAAGFRVTPAQLGILFLLKKKNMQTMSELSTELDTDNSAITRSVDRLEKSGLVERRGSANDRREICISITGAGLAEAESVKKIISSINKKIENEIGTEALESFRSILSKLNDLFRRTM